MNLTLDTNDFQKEFRKRIARSKRTLPEICNATASAIAANAIKLTKKTDKQTIEALGISGYRVFANTKAGKRLKHPKPIYTPNLGMTGIIAGSYVNKFGAAAFREKFSAPGKLEAVAIKELKSRMRGRGLLAAGWIPALRKIISALGRRITANTSGVQSFGKPKGRARPARDGWTPSCEFVNSAAKSDAALAIVQTGLQQAFAKQTAGWKAYAEKKLSDALDGK